MSTTATFAYNDLADPADLNAHFAALAARGIIAGGALSPVSGSLSVQIAAFDALSYDGMLVRSDDIITIACTSSQLNYIVLRAIYNSPNAPTLSYECLSATTYAADSQKDYLIVFGTVDLTSVTTVSRSVISYTNRDVLDEIGHSKLLGVYATTAARDLAWPSTVPVLQQVNDFALVMSGISSLPTFYYWTGSTWVAFANYADTASAFASHISGVSTSGTTAHLTADEKGALTGATTVLGTTSTDAPIGSTILYLTSALTLALESGTPLFVGNVEVTLSVDALIADMTLSITTTTVDIPASSSIILGTPSTLNPFVTKYDKTIVFTTDERAATTTSNVSALGGGDPSALNPFVVNDVQVAVTRAFAAAISTAVDYLEVSRASFGYAVLVGKLGIDTTRLTSTALQYFKIEDAYFNGYSDSDGALYIKDIQTSGGSGSYNPATDTTNVTTTGYWDPADTSVKLRFKFNRTVNGSTADVKTINIKFNALGSISSLAPSQPTTNVYNPATTAFRLTSDAYQSVLSQNVTSQTVTTSTIDTLDVTGALTVGTSTTSAPVVIYGSTALNGSLNVTGAVSFGSTFSASSTTLSSLHVTGTSKLDGAVTLANTLVSSNSASFTGSTGTVTAARFIASNVVVGSQDHPIFQTGTNAGLYGNSAGHIVGLSANGLYFIGYTSTSTAAATLMIGNISVAATAVRMINCTLDVDTQVTSAIGQFTALTIPNTISSSAGVTSITGTLTSSGLVSADAGLYVTAGTAVLANYASYPNGVYLSGSTSGLNHAPCIEFVYAASSTSMGTNIWSISNNNGSLRFKSNGSTNVFELYNTAVSFFPIDDYSDGAGYITPTLVMFNQPTTLASTLSVNGSTTLSSTLAVTSTATFSSTASIYSTLSIGAANSNSVGLEIGSTVISVPSYIKFHANYTTTDYDARIICTTGTGATGAGTLKIDANTLAITGGVTIDGNVHIYSPVEVTQLTVESSVTTTTLTIYGDVKACTHAGTFIVDTSISSPLIRQTSFSSYEPTSVTEFTYNMLGTDYKLYTTMLAGVHRSLIVLPVSLTWTTSLHNISDTYTIYSSYPTSSVDSAFSIKSSNYQIMYDGDIYPTNTSISIPASSVILQAVVIHDPISEDYYWLIR